jgi:hypothetical protein
MLLASVASLHSLPVLWYNKYMQKSLPGNLSEADLRRLLERWQKMLRLQQWHIKIRYARSREMLIPDEGTISWGRCMLNDNHLRATILILHPDDYEDQLYGSGREEIEATIVHELLHVQMCGMRDAIKGPDPAGDTVEEQVINVNSELLVALDRELRGRKK